MIRRLAILAAGAFALWLGVLFVLGFALGGRQERGTRERLAESLVATVTMGGSDLGLVRGRWEMDGLSIRRDDAIGTLAIDVASVFCDLPPLGLALVDRGCRELAVRGVRLEVSTLALFKTQRPKRRPIHADAVVIEDAVLVFTPSAFAPGMGRIEIAIERAVAGPTVLRTPLSWLFELRELRAKLDLPAGVTLHLGFKAGMLTAAGSLFGSTPVELPLELPVASAAKDAQEEIQLLVQLGKDIAERLVAKRAQDWLKTKLF